MKITKTDDGLKMTPETEQERALLWEAWDLDWTVKIEVAGEPDQKTSRPFITAEPYRTPSGQLHGRVPKSCRVNWGREVQSPILTTEEASRAHGSLRQTFGLESKCETT